MKGDRAIRSFFDGDTETLFRAGKSPLWSDIRRVALRKLDMLATAETSSDLRLPPGNRLEPLRHTRQGQHSIRINDRWRICFVWTEAGPERVEITDCHDE